MELAAWSQPRWKVFNVIRRSERYCKPLSEAPEFIVSVNGQKIALEHQIVIDPKLKEWEGFIENILSIAEAELAAGEGLPNLFVNCYLMENLVFQLSDVIGTPGSGMLYQHKSIDKRINEIKVPLFVELRTTDLANRWLADRRSYYFHVIVLTQ